MGIPQRLLRANGVAGGDDDRDIGGAAVKEFDMLRYYEGLAYDLERDIKRYQRTIELGEYDTTWLTEHLKELEQRLDTILQCVERVKRERGMLL